MKKRNLISSLFTLAVLVVFMASCSKKAEYTNAIPADATVIVSFNTESMVKKSGLTDKEGEDLVRKMKEAAASGLSEDSYKYMETLIEKPSEAGLAFNEPVYMFMKDAQSNSAGVVAKVTDAAKLKKTFELMVTEKVAEELTETDGITYAVCGRSIAAFNENSLLIMDGKYNPGEDLEQTVLTLLKQSSENSMASNKGFQKFAGLKGDITGFVSMAALPSIYTAQAQAALPEGINLKDIMVLGTVNFEKGKIAITGETYTENEEIKKLYKQQEKITGKLNSTFLDFFPASSLAYMSFKLNGKEFYKYLIENKDFQNAVKSNDTGIDLEKMIGSLDGDISFGLTSLSAQGVPSFVAYANMDNDYLIKVLDEQKDMISKNLGQRIEKTGENSFVARSRGMNIYMGMVGKHFYVTNDEATLKNIDKDVNNPMSNAPWAASAKKSYSFIVLNVSDILKLPIVQMFTSMGGQQAKMGVKVLSECSYIEVIGTSTQGEVNIILNNKDVNALKLVAGGLESLPMGF